MNHMWLSLMPSLIPDGTRTDVLQLAAHKNSGNPKLTHLPIPALRQFNSSVFVRLNYCM